MYEVLRHGAATPVFVDSSAVVAHFHSRDTHREAARSFFRGVREGDLRARPLYSSEYVVDEAVTTLLSRAGHDRAATALRFLRDSTLIQLVPVDGATHEAAGDQFIAYDDQPASFTDHVISLQARDRSVEHVLSFDQDFERFDLTTIPTSGGH